MTNDKKIVEEIARLANIKVLVETYETIAASSMRRIRGSVLQNRIFHEGLRQLYRDVKNAHQKEVRKLLEKKAAEKKVRVAESGRKTVYMFLSANTGLYGEIVNRTFQLFLQEWKIANCDAVIVGRTGKVLMDAAAPGSRYTHFDFPDNRIDVEGLSRISAALGAYDRVVAFYGSFKGLLVQEPTRTSISGEQAESETKTVSDVRFIFEPSLEVVATFFEKEIFTSLLEQAFHESRLAKLSSRLVLLDRANLNIDNERKRAIFHSQQVRHRLYNRKQLDALSGVALWNT